MLSVKHITLSSYLQTISILTHKSTSQMRERELEASDTPFTAPPSLIHAPSTGEGKLLLLSLPPFFSLSFWPIKAKSWTTCHRSTPGTQDPHSLFSIWKVLSPICHTEATDLSLSLTLSFHPLHSPFVPLSLYIYKHYHTLIPPQIYLIFSIIFTQTHTHILF